MDNCRTIGGFSWATDTEKFLNISRSLGWREGLKSLQIPGQPDKICEASAPNRLAWLNLVDINHTSHVLDIGAGTGGLACQLAKKCEVTAIDTSECDIEFLKIRAEQENLKNFTAKVASATNLPFADNTFDFVTMNGVLEWVGVETPERDPYESQLLCLNQIRRTLKPKGKFLLGIENRNFIGHYLGVPEPHVGLNYVSLLPRDEANTLTKQIKDVSFLEYTYNKQELIELVAQAGFNEIEAYWLYPDYRLPTYIISLNHKHQIKFFIDKLLRPSDFSHGINKSIYLMLKFMDSEQIPNLIGHYGIVCKKI